MPGESDGYAFEGCPGEDCVGVSGRGRQSFAASNAADAGRDDREPFYRWRDELLRALRGLSSVHRSGFARRCGSGRLFIEMSDWRQTDAAVATVANVLRTRDLNDAVATCVSPRHKDVLQGWQAMTLALRVRNTLLALTFLALAPLGCHMGTPPPAAAQSPVRGSFADVRTPSGAYDGYIVERACEQRARRRNPRRVRRRPRPQKPC